MALGVAALALLLGGSARAAPQQCTQLATTVSTRFITDPCDSPVGVCTIGRIAGGLLEGDTAFTATAVVVTGVVQHFEGIFVVTTDQGSITFFTFGSVNAVTGRFQESFKAESGTGAFAGAKGTLVSQGLVLATGFEGGLKGVICVDR